VRTIAIINQKGGSGKTTTAINLAAALARAGRRVLLVDVDPQSHCALGLAVPESQIDLTIGDALLAPDHRPPERPRLVWQAARGLDLIPSTTRLAGLEAPRGGLAERPDRDRRLALALSHLADDYDWCLVDCPPFIGLLTFNALRASDEVLIPVETGYFALQGAVNQVNTIRALGRKVGHVTPHRVLPTLHDPLSPLAVEILHELERRFEGALIPTPIRFDPRLRESVSAGVPVMQLEADSPGSHDYTALALFYETAPRLQAIPVIAEPVASASPAPRESEGPGAEPPAEEPIPFPRPGPPVLRGVGVASRAAELAARARALSDRGRQITERLEGDPRLSRVLRDLDAEAHADPTPADRAAALRPLLGARPTARGVLFLVEAPAPSTVAVTGDFNDWAPQGTPLRFSPAAGIFEALVEIPAGRTRYRLLIDGIASLDPHNACTEPDHRGIPASVVEVRDPAAPPAFHAAPPRAAVSA
jgi:chromosome partitioning protein